MTDAVVAALAGTARRDYSAGLDVLQDTVRAAESEIASRKADIEKAELKLVADRRDLADWEVHIASLKQSIEALGGRLT